MRLVVWGWILLFLIPFSCIGQVTGGYLHTFTICKDSTLWACGHNQYGKLGDGTTINRKKPVLISGLTGVVLVAGGFEHSIALREDGSVWTWGRNSFGQLGDGTTVDKSSPDFVPAVSLGVA